MCTVLLPPAVNPIAVNKYINIKTTKKYPNFRVTSKYEPCCISELFRLWLAECATRFKLPCYPWKHPKLPPVFIQSIPSRECNSPPASQIFPFNLRKPRSHRRVLKSRPLVRILSQMKPVHTVYFNNIPFYVFFQIQSFSLKWSFQIVCTFLSLTYSSLSISLRRLSPK
jgi:hypothetical protein